MKKIIVMLLSLVMVLALSVCAFADNDSFDPTLKIETSDDGKTITVTMNELPDGVSAELTIPCADWEGATVKNADGREISSTFGKVDANPDSTVEELVNAVTFDAEGGTYTITKSTPSYPSYYYPIVMPEEEAVEKPAETKPAETPVTPPAKEEVVTPTPEETTPAVPDEPVVDDAPAVDETPVVDDAPQSEATNDIGLWIGVALVVLVIAIVIVAVAIKRKK